MSDRASFSRVKFGGGARLRVLLAYAHEGEDEGDGKERKMEVEA